MIELITSLGLAALLIGGSARAELIVNVRSQGPPQRSAPAPDFPLPVYHIPLRIHLGKSGRRPDEFLPMLEEINEIWLSQAGICFEMELVTTEEKGRGGMDLWFMPVLTGGPGLNGYYRDDHAIQVRDTPHLAPAGRSARYPAARTAAHELGHGLGLPHRQDSDDNLMRSKTYGRQLHHEEIARAREAAKMKALKDRSERECGTIRRTVDDQ